MVRLFGEDRCIDVERSVLFAMLITDERQH
jgi:hypothetical protein